jgi:hypothetical protein
MGTVDLQLGSDLAAQLGLRRAVETGTYRGRTARVLAGVFPAVATIELSVELHRQAVEALRDLPSVQALQGHSANVLRQVADATTPTLFYLDGHWSGGVTAGVEDECPVLGEIEAIGIGHPNDCLVIDDANLFTSAPPPPHDPQAWPTILEVFDAIRARHPDHLITVLANQVIAVPASARKAVDEYGLRVQEAQTSVLERVKGAAYQVKELLSGRRPASTR